MSKTRLAEKLAALGIYWSEAGALNVCSVAEAILGAVLSNCTSALVRFACLPGRYVLLEGQSHLDPRPVARSFMLATIHHVEGCMRLRELRTPRRSPHSTKAWRRLVHCISQGLCHPFLRSATSSVAITARSALTLLSRAGLSKPNPARKQSYI